MNKPKHQTTNRLKKKMNKEIRASVLQPDPVPTSDHIKAGQLLSRLPKKVQKKDQSLLKSLNKNLAIQKKKKRAPHSKRTTPGTVDEQSPPHIIHVEGKRWIKTLNQQAQAKKKVIRRQMTKHKGR